MIHLCFEEDIFPKGSGMSLSDEEREEIEERTLEHNRIMALPRCPVCGEGPSFFKNDQCPYINAEDHKQPHMQPARDDNEKGDKS